MTPMPSPLRLKTKDEDLTWVQRLKKLEKKDVAALGVCLLLLGVLPVIEQVLTSGNEEGKLEQGFAVPGGGAGGPEGAEGYEPGVGPGAPGGLPGQGGGEVITPLAGRDPTSLVMGMGAPQKSSGGAGEKGLRDAMAEGMRHAVPEVSRAVPTPTATGKLSTSLANMLGGGGGGSGASAAGVKGGADILASAKKEPGRSTPHGVSYSGSAAPGYAGPAHKRGLTDTSGEGEKQKAAADAAAAKFNKTSGIESLTDAARASSQIGSDVPGGPGAGPSQDAEAKKSGPGPSTAKGDRSFGQSLDQQKEMARWQKDLERCEKQRDNLSGSFSAGLWQLTTSGKGTDGEKRWNVLNGANVDCSNIPGWINGPIGHAVDKYVGEGLAGAFLGKATEKTVEGWVDKLWPEATQRAYIDLVGSPQVGSTDNIVCDTCNVGTIGTPPRTVVPPCAYRQLKTKSKTKGKEDSSGESTQREANPIGDHCHKVGAPDEVKPPPPKNDGFDGNGGRITRRSLENLQAAKGAGTAVDPALESAVVATGQADMRAEGGLGRLNADIAKRMKERNAAWEAYQRQYQALAAHCKTAPRSGEAYHVDRRIKQSGGDEAVIRMAISECIQDHKVNASSHGGEAGLFAAASEKLDKAELAYLAAIKARDDCFLARTALDRNANVRKVGGNDVVAADEKERQALEKVCGGK